MARRARGHRAGRAAGPTGALGGFLGIPDAFVPIDVMPMGRPLQDIRSPSLKRGWVPFDEFAHWEAWEA
jgi:hypothetical protein